eukprot:451405_1
MTTLVLIVYICVFIQHTLSQYEWDYEQGTTDWIPRWPECGFHSQSPINIITNEETQNCRDPLVLKWTSEKNNFVIGNNGHSLQAVPFIVETSYGSHLSGISVLNHNNDTQIRLTNPFYNTFASRVNSEYCFDSIHFHWSNNNSQGSEHAINGKHFPLEAHLVHFSCDFYSNPEALAAYESGKLLQKYDDDNILSVVSVLFEIAPEGQGNPVLETILNDVIMDEIYEYDQPLFFNNPNGHLLKLLYTQFDLMDLLPFNHEIFTYTGSLTTPPCFETVRWNIMKHTQFVSLDQLERLRGMLRSSDQNDTIAPNWRPLQQINNRNVFECQDTLDALNVQKEPKIEDQVEHVFDECVNNKEQLATWFALGITFIILFGLSLIAIIFMAYKFCDNGNYTSSKQNIVGTGGTKYTKTVTTTDDENDTVENGYL